MSFESRAGRGRWLRLAVLIVLAAGSRVIGVETQTLAECLADGSCSEVPGRGVVCSIQEALVLSGSLSQSITILAASSAAAILLQPSNPLRIGAGVSLKLENMTINGVSFSTYPIDPASSLAWSGIVMQGPNSSLSVTGCSLSVDCPTWGALTSAVCDHGRAPGDSQVRGHGIADAPPRSRALEWIPMCIHLHNDVPF